MVNKNGLHKESGAALIIGLVLLIIATLLAVVTMQSSNFQEKMASNQNNKSISFMAAEMGGAYLLEELADMGFVEEVSPNDLPFALGTISEPLEAGGSGYFYIDAIDLISNDPDILRASIIGVSREESGGPNLALTELELRIQVTYVETGGGPSDAAINLVGSVAEFRAPDSNALAVYGTPGDDGTYGPAVATLDDSDRDYIEGVLASKGNVGGECPNGPRLCNYHGGIGVGGFSDFWTDPSKDQGLLDFIDAACAEAALDTTDTIRCGNNVPSNTIARGSPNAKAEAMRMKTTIVTGDANMRFSGGHTGAGLLVVTGNLYANGNPSWDGIIIVLGGTYDVKGGGNGGINGTIYVLNTDPADNSVTWKTAGGGNATYNHDCNKIFEAVATLGSYDSEDPPTTARNIFGDAHGCAPIGVGPVPPAESRIEYWVQRWVEVLN